MQQIVPPAIDNSVFLRQIWRIDVTAQEISCGAHPAAAVNSTFRTH